MLQNLQKWGKCITFLICTIHFLGLKKILNNFCIVKNLRLERHHEKKVKIRSSQKIPDIRYLCCLELTVFRI